MTYDAGRWLILIAGGNEGSGVSDTPIDFDPMVLLANCALRATDESIVYGRRKLILRV